MSATDLRGLDLRDANLRGANFEDADLRGADLQNANLREANLSADLRGADLRNADLRDANVRGARLGGIDVRGADLRGAALSAVPVVPAIDAAILAAVGNDGAGLTDEHYHVGARHDRAGWAIHLAGDAGYRLERVYGCELAATFIYAVSRPDRTTPDFYQSAPDMLRSLRDDARPLRP